jgi:4-aminobutyrate aminotransferase-like enzyme
LKPNSPNSSRRLCLPSTSSASSTPYRGHHERSSARPRYTPPQQNRQIRGTRYHGHHDSLLVKAGSGAATLGIPDSPGVPEGIAVTTLTAAYNDIAGLADIFHRHGEDIAAVIIEPVPGNMGLVLPKDGYLQAVRDLTAKYESLLIFDEVMSGFRVAYGGAQAVYGITPDLTCLGKVIAAACRSAPTAAGATSWSTSPPPGRSTRPAPSAAIPWP